MGADEQAVMDFADNERPEYGYLLRFLEKLDEARSWSNPREYVDALERHNLGPNVAAFIGQSDMRAATMGLDRATRKDVRPSSSELARMESMLNEALDEFAELMIRHLGATIVFRTIVTRDNPEFTIVE